MASYRDPIFALLIGIFNSEGPDLFKNRYFVGDPLIVPKSYLPAVFISKEKTQIHDATNVEDEQTMPISINAVLDLTRDFNQAFDKIGSASSLYEAFEARDATYRLKPKTLAYVLRKHGKIADQLWVDLGSDLVMDYGVGVEKRGPGLYSVEGIIHTTLRFHQIRPGFDDMQTVLDNEDNDLLTAE